LKQLIRRIISDMFPMSLEGMDDETAALMRMKQKRKELRAHPPVLSFWYLWRIDMQKDAKRNLIFQEREKTDHSLLSERSHTDRSLKAAHRQIIVDTNESIQSDRLAVDEQRQETRKDLDARTGIEQAGAMTVAPAVTTVAKEQLAAERHRLDDTIEAERLLFDSALKKERQDKLRLEQLFLKTEREKTDGNLEGERLQVDNTFKDTQQLLTEELLAHLHTKANLISRNEFLAIVSHDLRNPIGTILSCSNLLLEDGSSVDSDAKSWVELIKRNAETALRLISDLLDVQRMSSDNLELQIVECDIHDLIRKAVENIASEAVARSISLCTNLHGGKSVVFCDHDRIMQVLSNLLGNALKFTPKHGEVKIEVRSVNSRTLEISVSDSGPGVPDAMRSSIFERYSQLEKKDNRGLGLGLYIVKKIMDAHQGKVWVESHVGQGSRFVFILPRQVP